MHSDLWIKIQQFDFDRPFSEYGFSVRLAAENYWTENFAREAIEEYKKFMFLAATSNEMVSPSPIVDIVWHQHLIFTQSYHDFCTILGKHIDHVPSTHSRAQFQRFEKAKNTTAILYREYFGNQPRSIWEYETMSGILGLSSSGFGIKKIVGTAIIVFPALLLPIYYLLRPIYIQIENPYFLTYYIGIAGVSFILLERSNRRKLKEAFHSWPKESFLHKLSPYELTYLSGGKMNDVIHGAVNEMFEKNVLMLRDKQIHMDSSYTPQSPMEATIMETYQHEDITNYSTFLHKLVLKPVFASLLATIDSFKEFFLGSTVFIRRFILNLGVLSILFMAGSVRLLTGVARHKPVGYISVVLFVILVLTIIFLRRFTRLLTVKVVPEYYRTTVIPELDQSSLLKWSFFLFGYSALMGSFRPLVTYVERRAVSDETGSSSSCGSSCGSGGSSCGSCGGCGGGGD